MPDSPPVVFVVDDDSSVRKALASLIESAGWQPATFACAREFLAAPPVSGPRCLVLDFSLPELDGLELQARLAAQGIDLPIIFITGHGDVPMIVRAMKAGALEFLTKPFDDGILIRAIEHALERSRATLSLEAEMQALRDRHASLSRRQREVMALVCAGLLNKQAACELGISEITVKAHRGEVMRKMNARTLADLVRIAARLGVTRDDRLSDSSVWNSQSTPAPFIDAKARSWERAAAGSASSMRSDSRSPNAAATLRASPPLQSSLAASRTSTGEWILCATSSSMHTRVRSRNS